MKLLADVGLVGYPNVGKSTLISTVSNAKPEIAPYPFTTLIPHLGTVKFDDGSFVIADIPGLIEGASKGKGLGIRFLKHIERTSIILHILDLSEGYELDSLVERYKRIRKELESFKQNLVTKPEVVALNKIDIFSSEEKKEIGKIEMKLEEILEKKVFLISAISGEGVKELLFYLKDLLDEVKRKDVSVGNT